MKTKLKTSITILVLVAAIVLLATPAVGQAETTIIWTDKPDYSPGETVTISGSGFNPNANIEITITRPDGVVDTGYTTSDASGEFVYYYDLNGIQGLYTVTATDGTNEATTTFTDSVQCELAQGANDPDRNDYIDSAIEWITGAVNAQNGILTEGNIIPPYPPRIPGHINYRSVIDGLAPGDYVMTLFYEFTKNGDAAFDFLTTNYGVNSLYTTELLNNLPNYQPTLYDKLYALLLAGPDTEQIPYDTTPLIAALVGGTVQDRQMEHDAVLGAYDPRVMKLYGADITNIVQLAHTGSQSSDSDSYVEVYFTKSSADTEPIMFAWAGHLAIGQPYPEGYGEGNGAASVSGSPFHMKIYSFQTSDGDDVISGQKDVQLQLGAIFIPGEISGYKWNDLNGDGVWDGGEPPLEGWTINLDGPITGSDVTDVDGYYEFLGLPAGTYTVSETLQTGWTQTFPVSPNTHTIPIVSGQNSQNNNFGNFYPGVKGGYKWDDLDQDGVWDGDELGLEGWTIQLRDATGTTVLATDTTDADGYYEFTDLDAGTYRVYEVLESGWEQTYPVAGYYEFTVTSGFSETDNNFGNRQLLEFLKQFMDSGALEGYTSPEIINPITSQAFEIKTGPGIWWEVTYSVTNEDYEGHYYSLWDKWGGNLLILGSYPTAYTAGNHKTAGTVTLHDEESFQIDKAGYQTYLVDNGDISGNIVYAATHTPSSTDGAWMSIHTGDQQEGTNPGKGNSNSKDGMSYDVDIRWNIGWLEPGETAKLTVYLAPGINPGGVLQFSSYNCYTVNTGPRVRAYETYEYADNEFLYSWSWTNQLTIIVEPE